MSMSHDLAIDALRQILWELPSFMSEDPETTEPWEKFTVIKKRNVRKVHEGLWELQQYLGMTED